MNKNETSEFSISVIGDRDGEKWFGDFKCLRRLTHRQELTRDRIYRELLGSNPESAGERAKSQAEVFAELRVSIADAPEWWKSSDGGLELTSDNVVKAVYDEVLRIKIETVKAVQDKAQKASEALKRIAEEEPVK